MNDLTTQIISGIVTGGVSGAIGFLAAYKMAQRQRKWDAEDAAAQTRGALIRSIRVPLEIIRREIEANWLLYVIPGVINEITRRPREAIYELGDETLVRGFESIVLLLRRLRRGEVDEAIRDETLAHVETVLKRLAELEASSDRSR